MEQAGPVFKALKHYSLKNQKLSCNQVKHVLFEEDPFLPSNGVKPSLKMCTCMTTLHNAVETFTGHLERGTGNPIYKPAAIIEYTKQMGGVDLSDQLMNYYNFLRRSCKWWWKLWVHLFNMVILNGHVLNRAFGHQNNVSHYEYRYILVGASSGVY